MTIKISEIFYSIQGEIDVGKPVIFIRFSGCNLIREGKGCKFCDSMYAEEGTEMSVEEIVNELKKYDCKNVVITGGESLTQQPELLNLADSLYKLDYILDIETNGTLYDLDTLWYFSNINCSPKKQSINIEVLKKLYVLNTRFKFVYENKNDLWWEDVILKSGIENKNVYIMPEGKTRDEQLNRMPEVIEYCKEKRFNFTPRLHVLVWNLLRKR